MSASAANDRPEPRVFGLTGGYGSGKSTVATRLRRRRLPVIDADELAREVVLPGSEGLAAIVAEFGPSVVAQGALERSALARIVFADPAARLRLNAITHPRVQQLRQARQQALAAQGEPLICYEVPLLYENGLERELCPVVVVGTREALQIERAMRRDRHSEADVRARLAAQLPLADKLARADFVIENSGSREETEAQTDRVLRSICERLGVDARRYFTDEPRIRDLR
jgi:dephospho-CoA kinase